MALNVFFRVETGHGIGHIIRSLTLAKELEKRADAHSLFILEKDKGTEKINYDKFILPKSGEERKIILRLIDEFNPDVFILDILNLNPPYIHELKKRKILTVTIFDFTTKSKIHSDIIVNPNTNVVGYKAEEALCLTGASYVILRDCFRKNVKKVKKRCESFLITMGGSDPRNYTLKTIKALENFNANINIVIGPAFEHQTELNKILSALSKKIIINNDLKNEEICRLMLKSDIAISTAGNTMYELACLGVPNIVFCNHRKHMNIAEAFEKKNVIINLGINPPIKRIQETTKKLVKDFKRRRRMNISGRTLVDGKGSERIVNAILKLRN